MEALGQAAREIPAGTAMGAYLQEIRASGGCLSWVGQGRGNERGLLGPPAGRAPPWWWPRALRLANLKKLRQRRVSSAVPPFPPLPPGPPEADGSLGGVDYHSLARQHVGAGSGEEHPSVPKHRPLVLRASSTIFQVGWWVV
mgnify:FL=1